MHHHQITLSFPIASNHEWQWRIQLVEDVLTHHFPRNSNEGNLLHECKFHNAFDKRNIKKALKMLIWKKYYLLLGKKFRTLEAVWSERSFRIRCEQWQGGKIKMGILWQCPNFKKRKFFEASLIKTLIKALMWWPKAVKSSEIEKYTKHHIYWFSCFNHF